MHAAFPIFLGLPSTCSFCLSNSNKKEISSLLGFIISTSFVSWNTTKWLDRWSRSIDDLSPIGEDACLIPEWEIHRWRDTWQFFPFNSHCNGYVTNPIYSWGFDLYLLCSSPMPSRNNQWLRQIPYNGRGNETLASYRLPFHREIHTTNIECCP